MARFGSITNLDPAGEIARLCSELAVVERRLDAATTALNSEKERVGSVLTTIRSLFTHSVASGGTNRAIVEHFSGRLDVLARYCTNPREAYDLELLIREELRDFQFGADTRISISGHITRLQHDEAQAVGLAIHELVTNALKFGALSHPAGRLDIRWTIVAGELRLEWTETGEPGPADPSHHYGVGRNLIEHLLPGQLAAQTSFILHPNGLRCQIKFMLNDFREKYVQSAFTVVPEHSLLQ